MPIPAHVEQAIRAVKRLVYASQPQQAAQQAERTLIPLAQKAAQQRDWMTAAEIYTALARFFPASPQPWVRLGEIAFFTGNLPAAVGSFGEALQRDPMLHDARLNRGIVLQQLGSYAEAEEELNRVRAIYETNPEWAIAFGKCLSQRDARDDAMQMLQGALAHNPQHVRLKLNIAAVYEQLGNLDEAIACCDEVLAISPDNIDARASKGNALGYLMRLDEAKATLEEALKIRPDDPTTMVNLGFIETMQGNWPRGLALAEARFRVKFSKPAASVAEWDGQDLTGKTLFLYNEQALGDALMLARYAPLLHNRFGCRIIMSVAAPLVSLIARVDGVAQATAETLPPAGCDFMQSISSVPRVLNETPAAVPAEMPYLRASEEKLAQWRSRLGEEVRPRIAMFWRGSKTDANRAISLAELSPLWDAAEDRAVFYSLQKGPGQEQVAEFNRPIIPLGPELADFDDTAAVLELMDLVITIDTSVAHCAGGLARPTWTLLPFRPDWRWGLSGDSVRYYPTMRLFRQQQRRDWTPVISDIAAAFRSWNPNT
jgi:tetratricopeptide (TPR) repeat protein